MLLDTFLRELILVKADRHKPQEYCGFLIEQDGDLTLHDCINTSDNPNQTFEIAAEDFIKAQQLGEVKAIVHSHPDGEPYLSADDRMAQVRSGLIWVLVTQDGIKVFKPVAHLRGRTFNYGTHDCYQLLRDAYHLAGIELPDPKRTTLDADEKQEMPLQNAVNYGFVRVVDDTPQVGDVIVTSHGGYANHVALYLGGQEILHHAADCLSRRENYNGFWQQQTHSIWRHKLWQPEMIEAINNDLEVVVW